MSAEITPPPPPAEPKGFWPLRSVWCWLGAICFALTVTTIVAFGVVSYRARTQAARVNYLKLQGYRVAYSHEFSGQRKKVPEFLREWLGDDFWSEVRSACASRRQTSRATKVICEICGQFSELRDFEINSDYLDFEQIAAWPHFRNLETLAIHSTNLTDANLASIGQVTQLRMLELTAPEVTDAGFNQLAGLTQLESLHLDNTSIRGNQLLQLSGFPRLEQLMFRDSPELGDDAICRLGPLPRLQTAFLTETAVGDRAVAHLAKSAMLKHVVLRDTRVTDEGLQILAGCTQLQYVDLSGTSVTDEGLSVLFANETSDYLFLNRTALILQETRVTGTGLQHFAGDVSIRYIDLGGAALTPAGISALAQANIGVLDLSRTTLSDSDLLQFVAADQMSAMNVCETKVTANGVRAFLEARAHRRKPDDESPDSFTLQSDFPEVEIPESPPDPSVTSPIPEGDLAPPIATSPPPP